MRVIVCGDRHWADTEAIRRELALLQRAYGSVTVVEGEATGADSIGRDIAHELGMTVEAYPANWAAYGRAAGPIRNKQMLDSGVDLVLAFHANLAISRGTKHMVGIARKAGVHTIVMGG